jgi:hypothetical protein
MIFMAPTLVEFFVLVLFPDVTLPPFPQPQLNPISPGGTLMQQSAKLLLGLALTWASQAAPIQWTTAAGGNGHWYEYKSAISIFAPVAFSTALADATSSTHLGQTGYLVTITSQAEQDFIMSSFSFLSGFGGVGSFYIGASDDAVEGEWRWLGGPEAGTLLTSGFTNWLPGRPDNLSPGDDYAAVFFNVQNLNGAGWDDIGGANALGYVIEYNDVPPPNGAIPEPSTLGLSLAALAALLYQRRR